MILVYEYMPNGTLADHLHKLGTPLSWVQRLKICIGAARGLDYLHTGTGIDVGITHRDVKSSNILLHESWAARISDFGLSKIGPTNQPSTYVNTLVKGTFGYLDPDYSFTGRLTRKSDVYALGVVLLEVLCRRPALDINLEEEQQNLARWAQESIKEGNLKHIIDSGIRGEISPKCLKKFVQIAQSCLQNIPKQRPTMGEVVFTLESVLTQEKTNSSMQSEDETIFGRMLDMFLFPSNRVNHDIRLDNNQNQHPTMAEVAIGLDAVVTLQEKLKIENSDNHVMEAVESKDSVSSREEENNFFKPRGQVSATTTMNTTASINQVEGEWIEQCEPGVYLNLVLHNDGTRDIKRVRFSRRRFGEHQAETWWSENCKQVYERYNARGPMLKSHLPV